MFKGMDCFDCDSSTPDNTSDLSSVLISMTDNLKAETLSNDIMCSDEALSGKNMSSDLISLDNLEILQDCPDNVFSNSNAVMDCLSEINRSPVAFDLDNDDSVLPVYGPFAEFESTTSFETDVMDINAVPGVCGLRNLGNTCFMNAGLQCLLSNRVFKTHFAEVNLDTFVKGTLSYKFAEVIQKVWSGSYSTLHLGEFKECFGDMYSQFRNFRQHDCQEFLALLLDTMHEEINCSNKLKLESSVDCSPSDINNRKDLTISEVTQDSESNADCEINMEVCDGTEIDKTNSDSSNMDLMVSKPSTSSLVPVSDAPNSPCDINNSTGIGNVISSIKTGATETNATIYERNTEKMADLLINNKKLDKILNKNELEVVCNTEDQSKMDLKLKCNEKRRIVNVNENIVEKNELAYKLNSVNKIPSIEDFVKVTKTWNTNVLVPEETNNLIKFDSEKFPKHENNRLQETVDNLGQIVDLGPKHGGVKRMKITNIMHEKHKMFEKSSENITSYMALHKRQKVENMDANLESPLPEQEDAVEMEQVPGDEYSEGSSQSSELFTLNSDCQEILVAEEIRRAYRDWDQYKSLNQSVVVDTFHGQFRSSVVCSECSHNSITYEPFMYLPVFLPHTLERQIVVTYVQNNGSSPVRYLVTVNKFDRIIKIREALLKLLDTTAEEIILAEVFENHISRILDENQTIRRVNDSTRSVYAFEVGKNSDLLAEISKTSNTDPLDLTETPNLTDDETILKDGSNCTQAVGDAPVLSEIAPVLEQNSPLFGPSVDQQKLEIVDFTEKDWLNSGVNEQGDSPKVSGGPVTFHVCAICLEELPNSRLALHPNCECILCTSCIEVSCKHYGGVNFICPGCSIPVSPVEDFVSLTRIGGYEFKISSIPIPLVTRHDTFHEGVLKEKVLIGHPGLLKLPSSLPASKLYEHVDRAIPFLSTYSLLLVDGQGKNCTRCMYNMHCSGHEITREGDVKLKTGDTIAVRYVELTAENIAAADFVVMHKTMQQTRHKSELDIYDCLEYFSERESLDEDSPWYCPVCRQNQQATKSLSVWKFPEVLIIYLKRFVFHNFVSIKVEDKVSYPLEGLDLSSFSSGPFSDELVYDLQACVCHFGGVSAGHYTSYAKHAVTNEWYYYNDENVKKEAPKTDDCVNEYILFYQRR